MRHAGEIVNFVVAAEAPVKKRRPIVWVVFFVAFWCRYHYADRPVGERVL
jgi:hypothetical protein